MEIVEIKKSNPMPIGIYSPIQLELMTLLRQSQMTRDEIVNSIQKPRTTIYDNLTKLIVSNLVMKHSIPTNRKGRPLVVFRLI
jgi:predicted transcriptional regulator